MVQDSNHTGAHERASTIGTGDGSPDEKRKKVGNYVILRTIGEGSFAKVRLGVHLITEMKVRIISKGVSFLSDPSVSSIVLSSLFSSAKFCLFRQILMRLEISSE